MRLPEWLDTALEGGVVELQRALVRYRALRRLLGGDWRARAYDVAELSAAVLRSEEAVTRALDRALRRARHDPRAGAATHLAIAVEKERRRLADACDARGSLRDELEHLEDMAREESHLESAWRRFRVERGAMTLLMLGTGCGVPIASWFDASWAGFVPTYFSLDGLRDPFTLPVFILAIVGLVCCRLRLATWAWLSVKVAGFGAPIDCTLYTVVTAATLLCMFAGLFAGVAVGLALLTMMPLVLLRAMWFPPRAPLLS